jgi:DNA invertase Pin-like site-specific DNA recombinase
VFRSKRGRGRSVCDGVHSAELLDVIVDGAESAKSLQRPDMERVLALVYNRAVQAVIIAKLDRLTRSVRDLCDLLERLDRRCVALISVAESLDTSSAAGRLVLNIMTTVSRSEREAIGERTRDALGHKRSNGERATLRTAIGSLATALTWRPTRPSRPS